ncbi:MAG TPA: hypothetical protein VFE47_07760 [Tepidisphaeraceae bacterium]|nr:hypothetical protein [Tepidisphaeraceae bacterium]
MSDRSPLTVIAIDDPCPLPISAKSERQRSYFCQHCKRQVHNLSAMHDDEVQKLLCHSAGRLCVQFQQTPAGGVRTLDYSREAPPPRNYSIWIWTIIGAFAAMLGWGFAGSVTKVRGGVTCRPSTGMPAAALPGPTTLPTTNPADAGAEQSPVGDEPTTPIAEPVK